MMRVMISRARAAVFVCLLLGAMLLAVQPAPVSGQPADVGAAAPVPLTTDTMEYCLHLADVVGRMTRAAARQTPSEVGDLSSEGQRMCDEGQVRGGILRLRRAVTIMQQSSDKR
jgi:hypothetical protein